MNSNSSLPIPAILCASPVYWQDLDSVATAAEEVKTSVNELASGAGVTISFHLVYGEEGFASALAAARGAGLLLLLPMSGGIQPQLRTLANEASCVALANTYLETLLPEDLSHCFMHRNAHPACTDFYAARRLAHKPTMWVDSRRCLDSILRGWHASCRLRSARILKIGETEPWVINSCRDPGVFAEKLGTTILPIEREELYDQIQKVSPSQAEQAAMDWAGNARELVDIGREDIVKASRVTVAMKNLLEIHEADGLSMACFAMIGDIDTTSCLALASLNESAASIGACEGDLDSAATLFLMKNLGADFVWIANPILHPGAHLELAHCTAPRCACAEKLPYRLMRHHESGRGVAPEVALPPDQTVTLARIGDSLSKISLFLGRTHHIAKQPTCHTQIRVDVGDTRIVRDNLLGTHLVMSFGDWSDALRAAAHFLALEVVPAA
jgi:hypothetical protein